MTRSQELTNWEVLIPFSAQTADSSPVRARRREAARAEEVREGEVWEREREETTGDGEREGGGEDEDGREDVDDVDGRGSVWEEEEAGVEAAEGRGDLEPDLLADLGVSGISGIVEKNRGKKGRGRKETVREWERREWERREERVEMREKSRRN